jgi:hypothetical protein
MTKTPTSTPGSLLPATGGGIRAEDVIIVPEGKIGKPQPRKHHQEGLAPGITGPLLPQNWVTYASVKGNPPQLIEHFESTWQVPHAPVFQNNQVLYLFNGMQNAAQNQILQPVLQWGHSPWGGGNFWSCFPLFVDGQAGNVQVPPIGATPVAPGTYLTGYIHLLGQADGGHFNYEVGFTSAGVQGPKLMMTTDPMIEAVEVFETYFVAQAGNYPAQPITTFSAPHMMVAGTPGPVVPHWTPGAGIVNNHEHTIVFPDGHVDIHYSAT